MTDLSKIQNILIEYFFKYLDNMNTVHSISSGRNKWGRPINFKTQIWPAAITRTPLYVGTEFSFKYLKFENLVLAFGLYYTYSWVFNVPWKSVPIYSESPFILTTSSIPPEIGDVSTPSIRY